MAFIIGFGQTPSPAGRPEAGERNLRLRPSPGDETQRTVPIPRGYALVVGVGKYEKLSPDEFLQFPESDAEAIYRILISQQGGAFPAENVHKLIGPQATLVNFRRELEEWLPSIARPEDRVIVYFAGHGFVFDGRGYLAPWDIDPSNPAATAYPMEQLGKVMAGNIKARWKVLLADACHSGKIAPQSTDNAVNAQFDRFPSGFMAFTATRGGQKSYEDAKLSTGFGLFTYYIVQGLQGNADNNPEDGLVTADELIDYVREEVEKYSRMRGVSQTPVEHGDFDGQRIVLGANAARSGVTLDSLPLGSLVIETNLDDVEVYVDDKLVGSVIEGKPLVLPGLSAGLHVVVGARKGYEPDTKQVMVVPGQERSVMLRMQYRKEYKRSAIDLVDRGEKLLFKHNSSVNPNSVYNFSGGKQTGRDLARAKRDFQEALEQEPQYAKAAYDLALTCQALSDSKAMLRAFRRAIAAEPEYVEARVDFAGGLIEEGDPDEAIRQLTEAVRIEPRNDLAYSYMARAFLDKGAWPRSIEAADWALLLQPGNYEAFLWKADALRREAASGKSSTQTIQMYSRSIDNYRAYLQLAKVPLSVQNQLAYYFIGFGIGSRAHADRQTSYGYQHGFAYAGLCECEERLGNLLRAAEYCRHSLKYDSREPTTYFLLGNAYRDLYNRTLNRDDLLAARKSYANVIELSPDFEFARHARDYMEQIDVILPRVK